MPFLVLDRDNRPMTDPLTGLILHFITREAAEAYRRDNRGYRVVEVPSPEA